MSVSMIRKIFNEEEGGECTESAWDKFQDKQIQLRGASFLVSNSFLTLIFP